MFLAFPTHPRRRLILHTFLFTAHRSADVTRVGRVLDRAGDITLQLMPSMGHRLAANKRTLAEPCCGWTIVGSQDDAWPALVTDFVADGLAVVVYGEAGTPGRESSADTVHREYRMHGVRGVRQLGGCFSAIIVDSVTGRIQLVSDMISRRALRYFELDDTIFVSPHDVPLVATGHCIVDVDLVSVSSTVGVDWSIGGHPHLTALSACRPTGYLTWSREGTQWVDDTPHLSDGRVHSSEDTSELRETIAATLVSSVSARLATQSELRMDLTAGIDSRAIAAMIIGSGVDAQIHASCVGEPTSRDCQVAQLLAKRYGMTFKAIVPDPPSTAEFLSNCDVLAFYMNGDTNSKRALAPMAYPAGPLLHAGGGGGEIYRGFYYPKNPKGKPLTELVSKRLMGRTEQLPWIDPSFPESVLERLHVVFDNLSKLSAAPHDVLDLFYIYERMGIWGALTARTPWYRDRWLPFCDPTAVQHALRLPAPIGKTCHIHEALIRRHMKRACWVAINGGEWLAVVGKGRSKRAMRAILRANDRFHGRLENHHSGKTGDQLRGETMAKLLASELSEVLLASDNLLIDIFGTTNARDLLTKHISGEQHNTQAIGFMVTIQRWHDQIREARRLARHASH